MKRLHAARLRGARQRDVIVLNFGRNVARQFPIQFPLRTFDRDGTIGADVYLYLRRKCNCLISDSRHTTYQTYASSSPPTFCFFASRPDSTPREVERIAMPIPPRTRGISCAPTYRRRPGRLTRLSPVIALERFTNLLVILIRGCAALVSTT